MFRKMTKTEKKRKSQYSSSASFITDKMLSSSSDDELVMNQSIDSTNFSSVDNQDNNYDKLIAENEY